MHIGTFVFAQIVQFLPQEDQGTLLRSSQSSQRTALDPGYPSAVWPLPGACAPSVAYSTFLLHFVAQASQSAERGAFTGHQYKKSPKQGG